ncbi:MAG TPA: M28 family metallopeptidase [Steroidobacter sp.]
MRHLPALLLSAAFVTGAQGAERAPWSQVRADAIRGHVEFLASDLLEGRAAASRGYDVAAAYVAAQFRQAGLEPAGEEETYYQTVPLLEATPVLPGSSAELVLEEGTRRFEYGTHYLPSADFLSASSTLSAPLVFVGFGLEAPELDHRDLEGLDIQGRIAVAFSGAPAKFSNHERAYYSSERLKFRTLAERGAVGVVMVDSPADARRIPWERRVSMSWTPQMRWLNEAGEPQDAFPQLKLRFRFNHEAAAQLFEGASLSFEDVLALAEAGEPQGFELPGMLTLSATTGLRRTESRNVLGLIPGADAQLKNEYIVLTAHLDHLGRGSAVAGDPLYNGAQDNAVGVAIILEIARALKASGVKPRRSLLFAAVTAEEKGLLGSDFLAHRLIADGKRVVAALNVDMPLPMAPVQDVVVLGAEHSTLGPLARNAAQAHGYRLSPDPMPEEVVFIRSDQYSFIRQGIPALMIMSGTRAKQADDDVASMRRDFLQNHYHRPSDEVSQPLDYSLAADLARINLRVALEAATQQSRPRWHANDFFEVKFGSSR